MPERSAYSPSWCDELGEWEEQQESDYDEENDEEINEEIKVLDLTQIAKVGRKILEKLKPRKLEKEEMDMNKDICIDDQDQDNDSEGSSGSSSKDIAGERFEDETQYRKQYHSMFRIIVLFIFDCNCLRPSIVQSISIHYR